MTTVTVPNPYPSGRWYKITNVQFDSNLHLCRLARRPQENPDSEAVLSKRFSISYCLDSESMKTIKVPKNFITDGTSIPDEFKSLMKRFGITQWGLGVEASVVHDYLYVAWQFLKDEDQRKPRRKYKSFADWLFFKLLLECGVDEEIADTMRRAVSTCGWPAFKKKNPNTWYAQ